MNRLVITSVLATLVTISVAAPANAGHGGSGSGSGSGGSGSGNRSMVSSSNKMYSSSSMHTTSSKYSCYKYNNFCYSNYCWNSRYGCYTYWCPSASCYYWYAPSCCYYPLSYYIYARPTTVCAPVVETQPVSAPVQTVSNYTVPVNVQVASSATQGPIVQNGVGPVGPRVGATPPAP